MRALLTVVGVLLVCAGAAWYLTRPSVPGVTAPAATPQEQAATEAISLYFYDPKQDVDEANVQLCSRKGLVAVTRTVTKGASLDDRIRMVIQGGLTPEERARGLTTEYPLVGFRLVRTERQGSKAVLTFEDALSKTSGGACRAAVLWYQIEATALAYPGVLDVEFQPDTLFQP